MPAAVGVVGHLRRDCAKRRFQLPVYHSNLPSSTNWADTGGRNVCAI